ncbi:MAG: family 20 glycosylhydrolase, partial [Armatimonadetes bacterium]|nr:family 20 glycosylhydrolase [Armatimonadota bacterium]
WEQAHIKELGLKDEHELQSWLIRQMDAHLVSKGRRLIGWDEILEGGLAENATVMSWRGTSGGVTAAKQGHDVVMSPTSHLYLDYYQGKPDSEPLAIGGYVPLSKVYSFEPIVPEIPADRRHHVLGVQGNLWAEYMKTYSHMEYMAFPRACAVAEIGWSLESRKNYNDFLKRLAIHLPRLEALDVNFRPLGPAEKPAGQWKSGETSTDYQVKEWDISAHVGSNGNYDVSFQYTHGGHRLDIEWVEILINGQVAGRDEHPGQTGLETFGNTYRFDGLMVPADAKVTIRASIRSDGGSDSNGDISVVKR